MVGIIRDMVDAYGGIPSHGQKIFLSGEPDIQPTVLSHVQGIARDEGRIFLSHNHKGKSYGWMLVVSSPDNVLSYKFNTPIEHMNHPGGMQIHNGELIVSLEKTSGDEHYIIAYDLSSPAAQSHRVLVHEKQGRAGGAAACHVTFGRERRHLLARMNNQETTFYLSQGPQLDGKWEVTFSDRRERSSDGIQLLADKEGTPFLFRTEFVESKSEDWLTLYRVDLENRALVQAADPKHIYTRGGSDVHVRWGTGIRAISTRAVQVTVTRPYFIAGGLETSVFADTTDHGVPLDVHVHVQNEGDMHFLEDAWAGTKGRSLRLEGFQITLETPGPRLYLECRAHLEGMPDDLDWQPAAQFCGTRGQSRRLEGFQLRLRGDDAPTYKLSYWAHLAERGDTKEHTDEEFCGTRGESRAVEAIRVRIMRR